MPTSINDEERIWFALAAYNMGLGHLLDARRLTKNLGGNPDNWLDVKKNLPLLAEKRYYSNLKYGYARGYEAFQYIENIRRYMNSIVNYYRVQQNQSEKLTQESDNEIKNAEKKHSDLNENKQHEKRQTEENINEQEKISQTN